MADSVQNQKGRRRFADYPAGDLCGCLRRGGLGHQSAVRDSRAGLDLQAGGCAGGDLWHRRHCPVRAGIRGRTVTRIENETKKDAAPLPDRL